MTRSTDTHAELTTPCAIEGCTNEAEFEPYLTDDKPSYSEPHLEPSPPGPMCRTHAQENERLARGSRMFGSSITYPYTKPHDQTGFTRYKNLKTGKFLRLIDGRFPALYHTRKAQK